KVAVKVLHADFARDQQVLTRFLNEARAANAIRHPNIIEILDSGVLADRTPYLVMELLEGETLSARIKRVGPLPIGEIFDFSYQAASALSAAHAKGIVHRDLKPDNLFVVPDPHDDTRERLKVLDFGIAKLAQQSTADSLKTRTGTLMGTPIYMSPEQCRGIRAIDHRTDIYSLGVIMYEMVVGQPPFVSEGFGDLVNMHMNMAPPRPSGLRPDVPPALEALILTTLAKAPEERFEAMPALQAALKAAGEGFFTARGSSPNHTTGARRTRAIAPAPEAGGTYVTKQTTLTSAGAGEQIPLNRPKGRLLLAVVGVAALGAVGLFVARSRGGKADGTTGGDHAPVPVATLAATKDPGPSTASKPATPPAPAEVTLVVESEPSGARVVGADDQVLGATPLTLTRPAKGPGLNLRVEKDGYVTVSRTVSLVRDETLSVTLERKPRPASKPKRPAVDEPARL
ncbi:MAG TPA: protein kinase, partial [Polyangia bacterium]|nr:protein kinase [Polyangia bacterium]